MFEDIVTSVTLQLALYFNTMFSALVSTHMNSADGEKLWRNGDDSVRPMRSVLSWVPRPVACIALYLR